MVSRYWTAAATKFGEEQRAAHHIERQGFDFYLPRVIETYGHREKRDYLFPGYIFILISQGWERLVNTRGIRRMFLCGESPTRMMVTDIESIKSRESLDGFIHLSPRLAVGSKVTIKSGSFKDMIGEVDGMSARDRCTVLLSIMERRVQVSLSTSAVEVVVP